jgi:hypothetical protein
VAFDLHGEFAGLQLAIVEGLRGFDAGDGAGGRGVGAGIEQLHGGLDRQRDRATRWSMKSRSSRRDGRRSTEASFALSSK